MKEGKYIYCVVKTKQERNFGPIGVGGRQDEVMTIGYGDLSMVVSNHPMTKFIVNSENLLAHERVIEEVMKEFEGVLPVRFGTVAPSADEIRNLLDRRYREFKVLLKDMNHKIEMGLKGIWRDKETIFREIVEENGKIRQAKTKAKNNGSKDSAKMAVHVGKMVEEALRKKKEEETELIVGRLRKAFLDYRLNKTTGDEMLLNAAFLIDKGREREFDAILEDISAKYEDRTKFIYTGPFPVFNFVNIAIYPEEWEK